ncbi:MAG: hypothetical protein GDA43_11135 [Hormoscilla sp. SP5CHS1]|nr:hypothetical protein [Hormoscilla sp. SP12CHS1]MBC6453690.1 hypothetical protein [Hormoscilla sp. SP5CHS1]MBC6474664.1 hypothetical protein [Hormoscilla sp. GM102CHS1]
MREDHGNEKVKYRSTDSGDSSKGNRGDCDSKNCQQLQLFVMRGSQVIPNMTILSNNLRTCADNTQKRRLFEKLLL